MRRLIPLCLIVLSATVTGTAHAKPSTAQFNFVNELFVTAEELDNREHLIRISYSAGAYTASDTAGIKPGDGCTKVDAKTVTCPDTGIPAIFVFGGGINDSLLIDSVNPQDRVEVYGQGGNDLIRGSAVREKISGGFGADVLKGRGGDDFIHGRAGRDFITGGRGVDALFGGGGFDVLRARDGIRDRKIECGRTPGRAIVDEIDPKPFCPTGDR